MPSAARKVNSRAKNDLGGAGAKHELAAGCAEPVIRMDNPWEISDLEGVSNPTCRTQPGVVAHNPAT